MRGKEEGRVGAFSVILIIILLCIIGFLVWWFGFNGNGNSNKAVTTTSSQATQPTTAQKQDAIKANWIKFFNGKTPTAERVALLQNGQQFSQAVGQLGQSQTAKSTSATVSSVKLTGNDSATVTYTIDLNGQPALKNQTGQAVLENGEWKVSEASACSLLQIAGSAPSMCSSAGARTNQAGSAGSSSNQVKTPATSPSQ